MGNWRELLIQVSCFVNILYALTVEMSIAALAKFLVLVDSVDATPILPVSFLRLHSGQV